MYAFNKYTDTIDSRKDVLQFSILFEVFRTS